VSRKVNNEQMFIEKTTALEAWKKVQEKNEHTAAVVAKHAEPS
jgi:AICAR transformylase/IMP cyclohydrolase PurH